MRSRSCSPTPDFFACTLSLTHNVRNPVNAFSPSNDRQAHALREGLAAAQPSAEEQRVSSPLLLMQKVASGCSLEVLGEFRGVRFAYHVRILCSSCGIVGTPEPNHHASCG